jgi:hypothetical protein
MVCMAGILSSPPTSDNDDTLVTILEESNLAGGRQVGLTGIKQPKTQKKESSIDQSFWPGKWSFYRSVAG